MFRLRNRAAQATGEYAILIALVVAAIIGMQTYLKRGFQGRIRDTVDQHSYGITQEPWAGISNTSVNYTDQFEPWELSAKQSQVTQAGSFEETNRTASGATTRTSVDASKVGTDDYQRYKY